MVKFEKETNIFNLKCIKSINKKIITKTIQYYLYKAKNILYFYIKI